MKRSLLTTLTLACTLGAFSTSSFAGDLLETGTLSYADFVKSCQNPGSYGQQRPPENIRVACKNVARVWEPIEAGATMISESRNLSAELFSDKYHVIAENFVIAVPELNVSCPRLREVLQTSNIEKALTCAQVIAETRTLEQVCVDAIDEGIAQNPDLIVVTPTGKTFTSCSAPVQK